MAFLDLGFAVAARTAVFVKGLSFPSTLKRDDICTIALNVQLYAQ